VDRALTRQRQALHEASPTELIVAREQVMVRRNLAILFGLVIALLILAIRWNVWMQLVPAVIWLFAASQHFHVRLIDAEFGRRAKSTSTAHT
jgi:fatty acid desaturase